MRLIYCGTDVYLPLFEYFLKNHEILSLYTYHNDEDYFSEKNIVKIAKENNIKVIYEKISKEDIYDAFNNKGCELLICCEYAYIVPIPSDIKKFKGINIHGSLLPIGRGYYPIESALDNNQGFSGVTMHKLITNVDRGDIIYQESIDLSKYHDSIDVYLQASKIMCSKIKEIIDNLDEWWDKVTIQDTVEPYWKRPISSHLTINCEMTINEAIKIKEKFNKMSEVVINNTRYYIRCMETSSNIIDKIIMVDDDLFLYPLKDGYLRLVVQKVE